MAVVEGFVEVTESDWTNVVPQISGTLCDLVSVAGTRTALIYRAGFASAPPSANDNEGKPLAPGEGFEKKDLVDLTFHANPDALYVRSRNGTQKVWVAFEDVN